MFKPLNRFKKIVKALAEIKYGRKKKLSLGNLDSKRYWGHAKVYVRLMWMILQYEKPDDWVIATGYSTTVRDFVKLAFKEVGIELHFEGKGIEEKAYIASCNHESYKIEVGKEVLSVDPDYFRPTEVESLIGDPTKAKEKLGWTPDYDLLSLIKDMMQSDLNSLKL